MKRKLILIPLLILVLIAVLITPAIGCTGEQGLKGDQGSMGIQGEQGEQGEQGIRGIQGELGLQGETGLQGVMGRTGAKGDAGSAGAKGDQGEKGERGYPGSGGSTGPQGDDGSTVAPTFSVNLAVTTSASVMLVTSPVQVGTYSIRLQTTGTPVSGDEARIVITPMNLMTLAELTSIAWSANVTAGYPLHTDIHLDTDGDGVADESLNVEYAYNLMSHYYENGGLMPYGAVHGTWYPTFNDDGAGPVAVDDTCYAWLNSGNPGPPGWDVDGSGHYGDTLANWKAGLTVGSVTIDDDALVTQIDIEIDNWVIQCDAYVESISINGVLVWQ